MILSVMQSTAKIRSLLRILHQNRMSVRQRLRITFEARKADGICWRCARGLGNGLANVLPSIENVLPAQGGSRAWAQRIGRRIYDRSVVLKSQTRQLGLARSRDLEYKSLGRQYATAAVSLSRPTPLFTCTHHSLQPQTSPPSAELDSSMLDAEAKLKSSLERGDIREHLRLWQKQQDLNSNLPNAVQSSRVSTRKDGENVLTQSGEDESFTVIDREIEAQELEDDDYVDFGSDEPMPDVLKNELFLRRGDLVELG